MMQFDILTLFPDMVNTVFSDSIISRAVNSGCINIKYHQIREYTTNKQGKVDDYPYGGGPGLVMSYQPLKAAFDSVEIISEEKPYCIYMSPQGTPFTQKTAKRLSKHKQLIIICGHYEGVDERAIEALADEEISIGDYVLTGGEIPAMVVVDTVARLVEGVLSSNESYENESHQGGLLEYPQYTRPAEIDGMKIPDILLSGNHSDIEKWRLEQSLSRTKAKRPDMYREYCRKKKEESEIYFDNSATTCLSKEAGAEYSRISAEYYANPSSLHHLGVLAEKEMKRAEETLMSLINGDGSLYFTSGATESNNMALRCYLEANPRKGKHVIVSASEHPSVLETATYLGKMGYEIQILPLLPNGVVDLSALSEMIRPDTALISVMHVNSETGRIQPIEEISRLRYSINENTLLHSDCVQSFCKIPVDVKKMGVDMITVSGHKFHGPKGVGFLYVRKGIRLAPFLYGGGQGKGLRSGTENLPGICAMTEAAKILCGDLEANYNKVKEINARIREEISQNLKTFEIISDEDCLPYILNVSFPGIRAEVLQHALESCDMYVSVGSACSSHKKDRSHVLTAMGYNTKMIDGSIRLSFSSQNTLEQAIRGSGILCDNVKKLRVRKTR